MSPYKFLVSTTLSIFFSLQCFSQEMTTYLSPYSPEQTTDRFKKVIEEKGMILFDVISHHDAAKEIGKDMRPTIVVIFESAEIGTEWTLFRGKLRKK